MKSERKKTLGPWMLADQVCDRSSSCSCKVICRMYELPRPWSSLLSATDETEFYRQLAPFTAFLEAITRLSPPRQPWVSTHWRTVKNLLSLSCIPQRGGATERIWKFMEKCLKQGSNWWIQNLLSLNSPTQQTVKTLTQVGFKSINVTEHQLMRHNTVKSVQYFVWFGWDTSWW